MTYMSTSTGFHCWATYRHQTNSDQMFWAKRSNCIAISIIIIHFTWPNTAWALILSGELSYFFQDFLNSCLNQFHWNRPKPLHRAGVGSGCCERKTTDSTVYTVSQPKVGQRSVCLEEVRGGAQHEVKVVQDSGGNLASRKDHCCSFHNSSWVVKESKRSKGSGCEWPWRRVHLLCFCAKAESLIWIVRLKIHTHKPDLNHAIQNIPPCRINVLGRSMWNCYYLTVCDPKIFVLLK